MLQLSSWVLTAYLRNELRTKIGDHEHEDVREVTTNYGQILEMKVKTTRGEREFSFTQKPAKDSAFASNAAERESELHRGTEATFCAPLAIIFRNFDSTLISCAIACSVELPTSSTPFRRARKET